MRIGFVTASLSERAAGVAHAVAPLSIRLAVRGHETAIIGLECRRGAPVPLLGQTRTVACREPVATPLGWSPALARALAALRPEITDAQGLWMYPSLANLRHSARFRVPYVITPHGMLDPWALRRSAWKKRIAGVLFEDRHLAGAGCLRALNAAEAASIRAAGLKGPVAVVPNGVDLPPEPAAAAEGPPVLLFLGRIDPKKGIEALLAGWAMRASALAREGWRLQITGWGEAAYLRKLEAQADALGLGQSVAFTGPLFGEDKARAYRGAAAFALPSHSEGMPMAVLEAWSYGLPVLMSRACNIPEGFDAGAAVEAPPEPAAIAGALDRLAALGTAGRAEMGSAGRDLVARRFSWERAAAGMEAVYAWLLGGGAPPDSVSRS